MTPGSTFGDYKVIRRLGKGGMGEVWLLEGKSGRLVAAKILDPAAADDPNARRRFLREAELALGVRHPNLVETYDVGEDPETGLCYILMEYVPGGTLARRLKKTGRFPIDEAISVVSSIATVLELGRRKGIVHRDIKPANIMFDAEGTPKLSDLGIARAGLGTETTTVTQTGVMIGTPAYMSPEQMLDSHNVDTRADIYSLGVVFYEMLAGERPNKGDTPVELMTKAIRGEPIPDVRTVRPDVTPELARLINRMVAPNRDNRLATPRQVSSALTVIGSGALVPVPKSRAPRRWRRIVWRIHLFAGLSAATVLTVVRIPDLAEFVNSRSWSIPFFGQEVVRKGSSNDVDRVHIPTNTPPPVVEPIAVLTNVPAKTPLDTMTIETSQPKPSEPPHLSDLDSPPSDPVLPIPSPPPSLPNPPPEKVRPLPTPRVLPVAPAQEEEYKCEFVPRIKDWMGNLRYPKKVQVVSVKGCANYEVDYRQNSSGGESVVVVFRGKSRGFCFVTLEAEGKRGRGAVKLNHPMPKLVEVNLKD